MNTAAGIMLSVFGGALIGHALVALPLRMYNAGVAFAVLLLGVGVLVLVATA